MFVPFCWEILGLLFVFVVFVVASIIFLGVVSSKEFFCEKHYLKLIRINIMDREDPQKRSTHLQTEIHQIVQFQQETHLHHPEEVVLIS